MNDSTHKQDGGLTGQVLLAMPSMIDPRFERSVICMCAHNDEGAMGIVINKTLDSIDFRELLRELGIKSADTAAEVAVHFGGPVERQRGFVLHSTDYHHPDTMVVDDKVALTSTLDVLRDLARGDGPRHALLALGYAGWGPGQLEAEIQENAWLSVPYDDALVFDVANPAKWERAFNRIGVDLSVLSGTAGRA